MSTPGVKYTRSNTNHQNHNKDFFIISQLTKMFYFFIKDWGLRWPNLKTIYYKPFSMFKKKKSFTKYPYNLSLRFAENSTAVDIELRILL